METVYVLNKIQQTGFSGTKISSFIGVYSSMELLHLWMDHFTKTNPWSEDHRYHFEIFVGPLNGETKAYSHSLESTN